MKTFPMCHGIIIISSADTQNKQQVSLKHTANNTRQPLYGHYRKKAQQRQQI